MPEEDLLQQSVSVDMEPEMWLLILTFILFQVQSPSIS